MANVPERGLMLVIRTETGRVTYFVVSQYDQDEWAWKGKFAMPTRDQVKSMAGTPDEDIDFEFTCLPDAFNTPYQALGAVGAFLAERHDPQYALRVRVHDE